MTIPAQCPECQSKQVRRSRRRGALERIFSLLGYLPYRCRDCKHRFFFGQGNLGKAGLRLGLGLLGLILAVVVIWNLADDDDGPPLSPTPAPGESAQLSQEVRQLREELQSLRSQLGSRPLAPGEAPAGAAAPAPPAGPAPAPAPPRIPRYIPPAPEPLLGLYAQMGDELPLLREEMLRLEIQSGAELGVAASLWRELINLGKAPAPARGLASPFAFNGGLAAPRPSLAGLTPQAAAAQLRERILLLERQIKEQRIKNAVMRSLLL